MRSWAVKSLWLLTCLLSLSCKTGDVASTKDDGTPAALSVAPAGPCSPLINDFNFSAECACPPGNFRYNETVGRCMKATLCVDEGREAMFHPATGKCTGADDCEFRELILFGWRSRKEDDKCVEAKVDPNVVSAEAPCSVNINDFGFAATCQCPGGFRYQPTIGRCTRSSGRLCTTAFEDMFQPSTGKCTQASSSCDGNDMSGFGWRRKAVGDVCASGDATGTAPGIVAPTGVCTTDVNAFGFASNCVCPAGFLYRPFVGRCANGQRSCAAVVSRMFHPKSGKCVGVTNGCDAADMANAGWRERAAADRCEGEG